MTDKQSCCRTVYQGASVFGHPCRKAAVVERDGKWYCKIHDPVEAKKRLAASQAKWDKESEARDKSCRKDKHIHSTWPTLLAACRLAIDRLEDLGERPHAPCGCTYCLIKQAIQDAEAEE